MMSNNDNILSLYEALDYPGLGCGSISIQLNPTKPNAPNPHQLECKERNQSRQGLHKGIITSDQKESKRKERNGMKYIYLWIGNERLSADLIILKYDHWTVVRETLKYIRRVNRVYRKDEVRNSILRTFNAYALIKDITPTISGITRSTGKGNIGNIEVLNDYKARRNTDSRHISNSDKQQNKHTKGVSDKHTKWVSGVLRCYVVVSTSCRIRIKKAAKSGIFKCKVRVAT